MSRLFIDGSKLLHHPEAVNRWRKGILDFPLHMEVSPSGGCNQRCTLCCVDYLAHKQRLLPENILLRIAREMRESGVKSVLLAGEGEPTLNSGIVSMVHEASRIDLHMALNTNGVLLDRAMSREVLPALEWLRFSFQASDEGLYRRIHRGGPGDFRKAVTNVSDAVELRRSLGLKITIGIQQILLPENCGNLLPTARMARELGVDYYVVKRFSKHPLNAYSAPEDQYLSVMEELREIEELRTNSFQPIVRWRNFEEDCVRAYNRCIGISFIAHVLADGGVYPCSQYFHRPEYCYGYVNEASIQEIFLSKTAKEIQRRISKETDVRQCMSYCRHHGTNQFLSQLQKEPMHVEFI